MFKREEKRMRGGKEEWQLRMLRSTTKGARGGREKRKTTWASEEGEGDGEGDS